jgi:hypothetical protein
MTQQATQHHDVLTRVRKILAKAEDPAATPEEAETYTAKAAELVASYGIDRALLAEQVPESDVVGDRVVVMDAPYARDKASLLGAVAHALRCQAVHRERSVGDDPRGSAKELSLHLFGYTSDLERVEVLYTSLLLQATTQVMRASAPPWESKAAFRRSWLAGFTAAVASRLRDAEQRAATDAATAAGPSRSGRSVELVLLDRSRAAEAAMHAAYPRLGTARRRELSGSGGRSGFLAGQRADLGGTRVGRGSRRALTG